MCMVDPRGKSHLGHVRGHDDWFKGKRFLEPPNLNRDQVVGEQTSQELDSVPVEAEIVSPTETPSHESQFKSRSLPFLSSPSPSFSSSSFSSPSSSVGGKEDLTNRAQMSIPLGKLSPSSSPSIHLQLLLSPLHLLSPSPLHLLLPSPPLDPFIFHPLMTKLVERGDHDETVHDQLVSMNKLLPLLGSRIKVHEWETKV